MRLAIDDFGTGYSSFAYMRDLPVHEVKLDISFINDLGRNERDARVVAGLIRMAHELGLRVVAEGSSSRRSSTRCFTSDATPPRGSRSPGPRRIRCGPASRTRPSSC